MMGRGAEGNKAKGWRVGGHLGAVKEHGQCEGDKEAYECGTGWGVAVGGLIEGETGGVDGHLELPPPQQILILLGQKIQS